MSIQLKRQSRRKSIQHSDPGKILDLVMSLNDESCASLQIKINSYLREECEAETVLLIVIHGVGNEAFIEAVGVTSMPRKLKICMTPKLNHILKSAMEETDTLGHFGTDFQAIVTPHIAKDSMKKRIVLFPVPDKPFSVIACVVAPNMLDENVACIVHESFLFCWPVLKKTVQLEYECTLKQKCQQLLRVARRLFSQVASLETLLRLAMGQAKQLTKAEYCSVMLVDVDTMELVDLTNTNSQDDKETVERRFPMNIGLTGQVINTGNLINAKSVKDYPAFCPDIDCYPGVECKSLLCFPIREQSGIIGVGLLINKIGDPYFDAMDEEMALAFSIYCGVCIMHSVVYQKIQEAHIRNTLANELVMYHMQVGDPEVARMLDCSGYHNHPHLSSLHFNLRALPLRELPCYVLKMFSELGYDKRSTSRAMSSRADDQQTADNPSHAGQTLHQKVLSLRRARELKFCIKKQKLARFILHVKKSYRDVPYHSWLHAFSVAQWAFAALTNYKLVSQGYFTELQGLMYFIAGLVHDMDHRGTTNSFQISGQTTLAALYSSEGSVMERHHLAQAMCVLNTEGCDILETLPRRDYDRAIMMLRDYILATDLANYFKNLNEFKLVSMDFQKGNRVHVSALQSMLMNAADLGDQLKDWGSVKKTAAAVLTEFFKQGELEKSRGELPPIIMDREKCFIPDLEIQFLNMTCVPLFEILGRILPKAATCLKIIEGHIEKWDAAKPIFAEVPITAGLSVLLSPELDNLIEQNIKEKERLRLEAEAAEQAET